MSSGSAPTDRATPQVSAFYDRFPYPGDPLQDGPPPGYNWRWCHAAAHAHCTGRLPAPGPAPRILDAGCGTGVSTDYLVHLNPGASVTAIDISAGALEVAGERLRRSGGEAAVRFACRSLLDLAGEGPFEHINSVGVLHHLADPSGGLRALAGVLAPGGLLHLFLYADGGRWEIHRLQRSLRLLGVGTGAQGLELGRRLLAELPADNRLRRRHEERWALDTQADANFADMYLHPQETSYDLPRLWDLIDAAGLTFLGFSDPDRWDPSRLLSGELLERALALPARERWQLVEALDPEISHFEFFLSDRPLRRQTWQDDRVLLAARGRRNPCLWGWPGRQLLDQDLRPLDLSAEDLALLQAMEARPDDPLAAVLEPRDLPRVRALQDRAVLLLQEG
ncbi:MAG: class I SAM-dependent methyltransferase [Synechococcus sp. Tobar2m-G35]|jgi:SAM-dependent methyltransferase|nr:class I SAM-dependent methyltransferase [Synechococcus sp. Tobar2m-G35]